MKASEKRDLKLEAHELNNKAFEGGGVRITDKGRIQIYTHNPAERESTNIELGAEAAYVLAKNLLEMLPQDDYPFSTEFRLRVSQSIYFLPISIRLQSILRYEGFTTIGPLFLVSEEKALNFLNFGAKSWQDLKNALIDLCAEFGYEYDMVVTTLRARNEK